MGTKRKSLIMLLLIVSLSVVVPLIAASDADTPATVVAGSTSPIGLSAGPVISYVSPIVDERLQTIVIRGTGFGDVQPVLMTLGDGSVNTVGGGVDLPGAGGTPVIVVHNDVPTVGDYWRAGVRDYPSSSTWCAIGVVLLSWTDTEIVLGGFGTELVPSWPWNLNVGDQMRIVVITGEGKTEYKTTVVAGSGAPSVPTVGAPVITSVTPVIDERLQTITISGTGFGDVQPQVDVLSDGSVSMVGSSDSTGSGGTPVMRVQNLPMLGEYWQAGVSDLVSMGSCVIGVFLEKWSDAEIVLGGFGDGLDRDDRYLLRVGDELQFMVVTVGGKAVYDTTVVAGPNTPPPSCNAPVITSVTPVTGDRLQTIIIRGTGFGDVQPQFSKYSDGSVNVIGGGPGLPGSGGTPAFQAHDDLPTVGQYWQAGVRQSPSTGSCVVTIFLEKWSDTEIVLGGFGDGLVHCSQWNLNVGDQMRFSVITTEGYAAYRTTAIAGSGTPPASSGEAPVITSVTPVTADRLQTIVVRGSGFGNVQPVLMDLGDGSVNTVGGGRNMPGSSGTPVMQVHNDEPSVGAYWQAGVRDSPSSGACIIGVVLLNWSDTEIVLGGFGTGLDNRNHWTLNVGDVLRFVVITVGGKAEYQIAVGGGSGVPPYSYPNSTLPTPVLNVSCRSSSTLSDFRAEVSGSLTYGGSGVAGVPVSLYYSVSGGKTWKELTTVNTRSDGCFSVVWTLFVTGNYFVKAEWAGNSEYAGATTEVSFVVAPSDAENLISVASTSTVSAFAFNSTSGVLAFDVTGPSGTVGQTCIYVPKTLVADVYSLKVFLDDGLLYYDVESVGDSWLITFTYTHSTHTVTVDLNNTAVDAAQVTQSVACTAVAALAAAVAVLVIKRKRG